VLRGIECDILPDGRLDLPDDVLAELDWAGHNARSQLAARPISWHRPFALGVRCWARPL
jgi:hypothetical protein